LRQTLLDAPATPEHWSNSLKDTVFRVLIATAAIIVLMAVANLIGFGALIGVLAFFWAFPVVPVLLTYAAWREAKGNWAGLFMRSFLVLGVWSGVSFVVVLAFGILVA